MVSDNESRKMVSDSSKLSKMDSDSKLGNMVSDNPPLMSKTMFFGGSLASVSGGMFYGYYRTISEEKTNLGFKVPRGTASSAGKAFIAGTFLACGAFIAGASLFVATTGITTSKEFEVSSKKLFRPFARPPSKRTILDELNTKGMTEDEKYDYYYETYIPKFDDKGNVTVEAEDYRKHKIEKASR
jgi:hypothetical protein